MMIHSLMRTTRRPKVAYLVNQYPLGSHTFIRREIVALERAGFEVQRISIRDTAATLTDPDDVAEADRTHVVLRASVPGATRLGAAVIRRTARHPRRMLRGMGEALRLARRARRGIFVSLVYLAEAARVADLLEESGAAHMHAHFGTNSAGLALLTQTIGGPGFSFTAHGPEEFDRAEELALRDKICRSRFVAGVSSFGRSQLLRHTPGDAWAKVKVVPCGVDDTFLAPPASSSVPTARRLVCVGRLCEQKGQLVLIEAAAELAAKGEEFELVLVGDGELRGDLERALDTRGLRRHVRLVGWGDGALVREEILAARALVLPSFAEGLPVVLMEAFALCRPVVATWVAGIPELVTPGACGWLVPPGDVPALAAAMRAALEAPPETLEALGREGRARVLARHDARVGAGILADEFRAVLRDAPP